MHVCSHVYAGNMPVTPTCVHRRRWSSTASPGAAPPSHKECSPGSPTCHRGSSLPRGHSAHFLFVFVDGICLIAGVVPCLTCLVLNDFLVFSGKRLIVFDRAGMMFNPSTCSRNLTTFATLSCNLSCTDFMIFEKENHLRLFVYCVWPISFGPTFTVKGSRPSMGNRGSDIVFWKYLSIQFTTIISTAEPNAVLLWMSLERLESILDISLRVVHFSRREAEEIQMTDFSQLRKLVLPLLVHLLHVCLSD